jgi:hypothetical protein
MFEALDPCGLTLVSRIEIVAALLATVIETAIDSVQGENEEQQEQFAFVTVNLVVKRVHGIIDNEHP